LSRVRRLFYLFFIPLRGMELCDFGKKDEFFSAGIAFLLRSISRLITSPHIRKTFIDNALRD
jgi:hypothetical protein